MENMVNETPALKECTQATENTSNVYTTTCDVRQGECCAERGLWGRGFRAASERLWISAADSLQAERGWTGGQGLVPKAPWESQRPLETMISP